MAAQTNYSPMPGSPVSSYFGLGGAGLVDQTKDETEELRKKRMAMMQGRPVSGALGYGQNVLGGPATLAFGGVGALGR